MASNPVNDGATTIKNPETAYCSPYQVPPHVKFTSKRLCRNFLNKLTAERKVTVNKWFLKVVVLNEHTFTVYSNYKLN